jgi:shikimate dehydrogenase
VTEGRRAAVLGHPIAHSLSPVLHRAAYAELGLTGWSYEAVDVDEAGLSAFLAGLDGSWAGLSLTMPLKRAVRPLLVRESELARAVGAVNTVVFTEEGPVGHNTDVQGIVSALAEAGVRGAVRVALLGGGATATSALAAVGLLGAETTAVHVRRATTTTELQEASTRLGVRVEICGLDAASLQRSGGADVVISTLPGAAADALAQDVVAQCCRLDGEGRLPVLLDVGYAPWPTVLAQRWGAVGGTVVGGFAMLLHQAAEQVLLMTGLPAPLAAMRRAGEAELGRRTRSTIS